MNATRIIPAGPMPHDAILPLIREVGQLRERASEWSRKPLDGIDDCARFQQLAQEYRDSANELEERIRQPITVAGRVIPVAVDSAPDFRWWDEGVMVTAHAETWRCVLSVYGNNCGTLVQTQGTGPTIASALSDARDRYQAAIGDTLLRMGGLLREVVL